MALVSGVTVPTTNPAATSSDSAILRGIPALTGGMETHGKVVVVVGGGAYSVTGGVKIVVVVTGIGAVVAVVIGGLELMELELALEPPQLELQTLGPASTIAATAPASTADGYFMLKVVDFCVEP